MGVEANSSNRWRTARERTRLKARYEIHSRIAHAIADTRPSHLETYDDQGVSSCRLHMINTVLRYLQSIIKNDLSSFSIAALARDGWCISRSLPNHDGNSDDVTLDLSRGIPKSGFDSISHAEAALAYFLSSKCPWDKDGLGQLQPATLAASKFGRDFVMMRFLPYLHCLKMRGGQITLMEYSSLLGRHGIVGQLLLGGINPTISGYSHTNSNVDIDAAYQSATRKVMRLIHSLNDSQEKSPVIPLSLWGYIVRSVVEMRINGMLGNGISKDSSHGQDDVRYDKCQLCNEQSSLVVFGKPCHHSFCESCLWYHLVQYVSNCVALTQNVVTCPSCHAEFGGFQYCPKDNRDIEVINDEMKYSSNLAGIEHESKHEEAPYEIYEQRRLDSLEKFVQFPHTSTELKLLTKKHHSNIGNKTPTIKRKKLRDPISSTWYQALHPIISNHLSKDVRTDRFFKAVLHSPQVVMCYLRSGIDVNMKNEYGQTPLYVACWRGNALIVQCLLEYGADVSAVVNGGSTCWSVAKKLGRMDVLAVLERYSTIPYRFDGIENGLFHEQNASNQQSGYNSKTKPTVSILVDPLEDHPGAGACIVDNALSEEDLRQLEKLSKSLPEVSCDGADDVTSTNNKTPCRPSRAYFCDAEQIIQTMLKGCVDAARTELKSGPNIVKTGGSITPGVYTNNSRMPPSSVFHHLRFLNYKEKGGILPPHVDLCRIDDSTGHRSTHTFILYLTDCKVGGGTALLQHLSDPKVLAIAQPKRGRALIFPHLCPHSGLEVECVPKILLRGEVIL